MKNSFVRNKNNKCFPFADPPIVTLRLGSTLSDNIKEGDDVYFECLAVANPQWRKLYWLHDVSKKKTHTEFYFVLFSSIFSFFAVGIWFAVGSALLPFNILFYRFYCTILLGEKCTNYIYTFIDTYALQCLNTL